MNLLMGLLEKYQHLLVWMGIGSVFVFIISLLSLPWLAAQIPDDYFVPKKRQPTQWKTQRPLARLIILIGKNCLGYVLLLGGILMLFLPGQGLLTMITGLLLVDYPGKFRIERKIVNTPAVLKSLNWLRAKAKKPPLI
jgi:archaellum biogenesis protein FlaJ (TadC family)